jgi:predicted dehydrogenase
MVSTLVSTLFSITSAAEEPEGKDIRVGIIGLDTSHVVAFTKLLNGAGGSDRVSGARVVAGFPGGTADNPASASRVEEYTKELSEKWGVEIVPDIPTLLAKVDAVLLESVDGRPHLEQVRPVLAARKPVYIDKPLAGSFRDAREIVRLAKESGVPCFSASSLRFWPGVAKLRGNDGVGEILGCDAYSPCHLEEHHPDLYWYGVHGVEILFALMGPGCVEVSRTSTSDFDLVVGRWKDGRVGTYRGIRKGAAPYGASVFGTKGMRVSEPVSGDLYRPLVAEIVKFFRTGEAPVPLEETLEMFAFMSAADLSEERKGAPVRLEEILEVGAAPDDPRGRTVVLAAGEIEVKEFARFLGHFTGLPVISSGGEGFLQKRITIAAPVRDVDDELARKILGLGGVRARERTIDGRRVLILEDAESPEPPLEPEPRPIIVPGKPAGK